MPDKGRFAESLYESYRQEFNIDGEMIAEERSQYQEIRIFDNELMGRVLTLDGVVQLTNRDEAAYSEMLVHVPALEGGPLRQVLIIGGGDGAVAEEALKYDTIEKVTLVDIDGRVIDLSKQYLQSVNKGAFDDPRLDVIVDDAAAYLKSAEVAGRFDLIVADRPDPVGPGTVLFEDAFYTDCARALAPGGIAVYQTGCPHLQPDELVTTLKQLKLSFAKAGCYLTVVPTYIGGYMALTWASNDRELGSDEAIAKAEARFRELNLVTDHYTPGIHRAAFGYPAWIEKLLARS